MLVFATNWLMDQPTLEVTDVSYLLLISLIKIDSWGLKDGGALTHNDQQISLASPYGNDDKIGVLLDMNRFTLDYFINGDHVLKFCNPDWAVRERLYKFLILGTKNLPSCITLKNQ
jgi:hypothetical protein